MTVAENIALSTGYHRRAGTRSPGGAPGALCRRPADRRRAPRSRRADRPPLPAERSLVAIARALAARAKLIVLDEPTARLPATDCARLFRVLHALRDQGHGLLYVTHRLDEVYGGRGRLRRPARRPSRQPRHPWVPATAPPGWCGQSSAASADPPPPRRRHARGPAVPDPRRRTDRRHGTGRPGRAGREAVGLVERRRRRAPERLGCASAGARPLLSAAEHSRQPAVPLAHGRRRRPPGGSASCPATVSWRGCAAGLTAYARALAARAGAASPALVDRPPP
ncbi:hypothetical protein LT493_12575 [Streptomyces tricolor]|nr:hypothetical protein [Streptomyces tricolor]